MFVISDCHLSAGHVFEGKNNPHEDFHFDEEMCDLFRHFSTGKYGDGVHVELVIAGDYFDYLNVPVKGEFEEAITEEMSVEKTKAIIAGHPKVMKALKHFASMPDKHITYLIGNHDADLAFPKVREEIIRAWDPHGHYPSEKVTIIHDSDKIIVEGGAEIWHGMQLEAGNSLNFENPIVTTDSGMKLLSMPWGSIYVLKIVNRLKGERDFVDKIRPIKLFIMVGIVTDTFFTLKFCFLSWFYFLKTRLFNDRQASLLQRLKSTILILKEQSLASFQDLERPVRKYLDHNPEVNTIIVGHSHRAADKTYPDGRQYINTGTWTKMVYLDFSGIGMAQKRPFAFIHIQDGKARCELRQWVGEASPHRLFNAT